MLLTALPTREADIESKLIRAHGILCNIYDIRGDAKKARVIDGHGSFSEGVSHENMGSTF